MKGLSTWIWVIGGITISILAFSIFLNIFSDLNIQRHRVATMESFEMLSSDINSFCDKFGSEKFTKKVTFSDLTSGLYASADGVDRTNAAGVSRGKGLCINFTNHVECKKLSCEIQLSSRVRQKGLLSLINKITGSYGFQEYEIRIYRVNGEVRMEALPYDIPSGALTTTTRGRTTTTRVITTTTLRGTTTTTFPASPDIKLRLIFVPVNWGSDDQAFRNAAEDHFKFFIKNTPLEGCDYKAKIEIIPVSRQCHITPNPSYPLCNVYPDDIFVKLRDCANRAGYTLVPDVDRIVGITTQNIQVYDPSMGCLDHVAGYAQLRENAVIVEHMDPSVTAHELGHTYGLCDEYAYSRWTMANSYLQSQGLSCPNSYPDCCGDRPCCVDHPPCSSCDNCLSGTPCTSTLCAGNICDHLVGSRRCRGIMGPAFSQNDINTCFGGFLQRRYGDKGAQQQIDLKLSC